MGLIGYSRGAMHGLAAAELMPEIGASVGFVGGTPFAFYERDAQADPLNAALAAATGGARAGNPGCSRMATTAAGSVAGAPTT